MLPNPQFLPMATAWRQRASAATNLHVCLHYDVYEGMDLHYCCTGAAESILEDLVAT